MKNKRHTLLVVAGFAIFFWGCMFATVGGALMSPVAIENKHIQYKCSYPPVIVTRGYIGLFEFEITDDDRGNFEANIGIRNPFK